MIEDLKKAEILISNITKKNSGDEIWIRHLRNCHGFLRDCIRALGKNGKKRVNKKG